MSRAELSPCSHDTRMARTVISERTTFRVVDGAVGNGPGTRPREGERQSFRRMEPAELLPISSDNVPTASAPSTPVPSSFFEIGLIALANGTPILKRPSMHRRPGISRTRWLVVWT